MTSLRFSKRNDLTAAARVTVVRTYRFFPVTMFAPPCNVQAMQAKELKKIAERQPFQPFGVRLSNGAHYFFDQPRRFGAPGDFREIFFFGDKDWVIIDSENIVEVFRK
jgi:hypothetical protein